MEPPKRDTAGRLGRLGRLTLKELREILRDRRTVLTLVLMPLLLYPVLSIAFQQFFLAQLSRVEQPVYALVFRDQAEGRTFMYLLAEGGVSFEHLNAGNDPATPHFTSHVEEDFEAMLNSGQADVALRPLGTPRGSFDPNQDLALDAEVLYREDSTASREAAELVQEALRRAGERFLELRLRTLQVSQRAQPIVAQRRSISQVEAVSGRVSLAAVIPLILTLMTVTGAVYPAIDLTAGERERGTLEILVAAPIPRIGVLFAKYVAVLAVALLTAAANLLMMTLTLQASGLGRSLFGSGGLTATNLGSIFALLLLFAAFYSAVLLVVTCTARSFKEAQAYLIPVILLSLAPGVLCLMPGMKLEGLFLVMPLANIVLLGRDLLTEKATAGAALAVVGSTALYAAASIGVAARIFGAESVLYSSNAGWGDLFHRTRRPQPAPTVTAAVVTVAVIFPLFFLLQGLGNWCSNLTERLILGAVVTGFAFGVIPTVVCWFANVNGWAWYGTRGSLLRWPAVIALGFSLWALDHELIVAVARARGVDFSALLQRLGEYAGDLRLIPPWLIVLLIAVVPAVFEEYFFRGFLWESAKREHGEAQAWIVTSLVFGAFHLIMPNPLAIERLVATTAMGFILGWVRRRTGSVLPGTLLHCLHNASATLISYYSPSLQEAGLGQAPTEHLPAIWLVSAGVLSLAGAALLALNHPPPAGNLEQGTHDNSAAITGPSEPPVSPTE